MNECEKCKLWDEAAKKNGHESGICQDCFDKQYVNFQPIYEPTFKDELKRLLKQADDVYHARSESNKYLNDSEYWKGRADAFEECLELFNKSNNQ